MTDLADALAALRSGTPASAIENDRIEFKQADTDPRRTLEILADAVVCLANGDGGLVVLGVRDRPGPRGSLAGVDTGLSVDAVVRGIFDRTRPSLSVPVQEVQEQGARLLAITVPRGATFYANAKGVSTRRVGAACRPFPPEEQRQAMAARGLYDWSAAPAGVELSAVSADEVDRIRRLLAAAGREDTARQSDARILHDLRLLDGGELTRAGLLLVGTEAAIARTLPSYGYAYQYRPSAGSEATARLRERRPLLAAVERLLDAVEARRSVHPINVRGGVQLQLHDYPASVVRELVVNALVHRDYEFEGEVELEHTPTRLVISSPGGLVFGVTPQNILSHPSTPRNRLLLETVTTLQVAERTGQGVDRAYRDLLRIGKQPPRFTDDGTRVTVTVEGGTGDDAFARYVNADLDPRLAADLEVLYTLSYLRTHRSVNGETVAPGIQRSPAEAQQTLDRMAEAELVEPSRRTVRKPFPNYALAPIVLAALGRAVAYRRRDAADIDQKIVDHVSEYGYITNQTLRRLFDLGVYPARDLLRDLQERGVLRKLDEKAGGPGIRYGRGPNFPARRGRRRRSADQA